MKNTKLSIIPAVLVLGIGIVFQLKGNLFLFGLCSGVFVTLLNSFLVYLSVRSIGTKTNTVLKYMLEMLFIRMPLLAVLIFVFIVKFKAGILGFALGITAGFVYGMYRIAKFGSFEIKQETI